MAYQSVTNIENAVVAAAGAPNAAFTQLITLPEATWEGRTCRAVRVGAPGPDKVGVYFLGGVHAREWGSPDILVRLIADLTQAYRTNHGLTYGGKSFSANDVKAIVDKLDLYVFPQANPDGRQYSMASVAMWRKNKRPDPNPNDMGVDVNRNFDWLWYYPTYFSPSSGVVSSTTKSSEIYIGPSAESEPEVRNAVSIVTGHPGIRFFVDLHSYSQDILYGWGDDNMQSADPGQNFLNPAYDGQRGVVNSGYAEFIPAADKAIQEALGLRMKAAIQAAGGPPYTVMESVGLYPTSGTSGERMAAFHSVDLAKAKIHPYTIEWGTQFQPPWSEMALIVEQICAGLLDFCLGILALHSDVYVKDNVADTGAGPSGTPFWESPDIAVRQVDDGQLAYQPPKAGQDNYVYVQVHNRGPNAAGPTKVSLRAVAYAGTEFVYPHDWAAADATHVAPVPVLDTFASIPAGGSAVAKFQLTAAQTGQLGSWETNGWHPCLLAEVDCATDFSTPGGVHVWENNNLAQRNITVLPALAGQTLTWAFLFGHELRNARELALEVEQVDVPKHAVVTLDLVSERAHFTAVHEPALAGVARAGLGSLLREVRGAARVGDTPVLRLSDRLTRLDLTHLPRALGQAVLGVTVPEDAKTGDVYRFRVAQHDANGTVVGGVTLEVPVVG